MGQNSAGPWSLQLKNAGESCRVGAASQLPSSEWCWARYSASLGLRLLAGLGASLTTHLEGAAWNSPGAPAPWAWCPSLQCVALTTKPPWGVSLGGGWVSRLPQV